MDTDNAVITGLERTVLNEDGGNRPPALIKFTFDNSTFCRLVRVGFEIHYISLKQNHLQEALKIKPLLGRNLNHGCIAAPLFGNETLL